MKLGRREGPPAGWERIPSPEMNPYRARSFTTTLAPIYLKGSPRREGACRCTATDLHCHSHGPFTGPPATLPPRSRVRNRPSKHGNLSARLSGGENRFPLLLTRLGSRFSSILNLLASENPRWGGYLPRGPRQAVQAVCHVRLRNNATPTI